MPAGRVRPMMLAGNGARRWALARGLPAAASAEAAEQVLPSCDTDPHCETPILDLWGSWE